MTDTLTRTTVWTIDSAHTFVEFSIRHLMFATVRGRFLDIQGTITFDNEQRRNDRVEVEIGAGSIDTGHEQRDVDLRSRNFFDVGNFPMIRFSSTGVVSRSDTLAIAGDLTIKGVTRSVVFDATYNGRGTNPSGQQVTSYSARTTINRADFGLTANSPLANGGVVIGEEVTITMEIEAFA